MWQGLTAADVPAGVRSVRAWRRSWLLGFTSAVIARVRAAEQRAAVQAGQQHTGSGPGTALVLADRSRIIEAELGRAYPVTRKSRMTYSGNGYGAGYAHGQQADLGSGRLTGTPSRALDGGAGNSRGQAHPGRDTVRPGSGEVPARGCCPARSPAAGPVA